MSVLDAFLSTWARARATFGEGTVQNGDAYSQDGALQALSTELDRAAPEPVWSGGAAQKYGDVNARQQRVISALGDLDVELSRQIDRSAQIVDAGRRDLELIRQWILAAAGSAPNDQAGRTMLSAIASAGLKQVSDTMVRANGELNSVGQAIHSIDYRYRQLGVDRPSPGQGDGTIHTVDFPQAPPPPAYPANEVIAEATDLDGNHVVLRRGYYDASTQQGFGWDKAYWRHHVVNPNVFTDLISHSRPKSNEGGTVVYEVPINRVHCTRGFLGIPDYRDTGESVTMRIVANLNEGNPAVPGGGQKGVISMYPLAGGSGVVEVQPGWTLTPPWVNNNVPIN